MRTKPSSWRVHFSPFNSIDRRNSKTRQSLDILQAHRDYGFPDPAKHYYTDVTQFSSRKDLNVRAEAEEEQYHGFEYLTKTRSYIAPCDLRKDICTFVVATSVGPYLDLVDARGAFEPGNLVVGRCAVWHWDNRRRYISRLMLCSIPKTGILLV